MVGLKRGYKYVLGLGLVRGKKLQCEGSEVDDF